MNILAFDSTAKTASVALVRDGKTVAEFFVDSGKTHSEILLPMAEDILARAHLTLDEVDYYAVTVGPGSFTGVRIGTATVKEGGTVQAPVTPTRDGYTFKGWSSALTNITANKTVTAQYTLVSAANVFDIAYKVSGNTVTLTLSLAGNVSLAGFEGTLAFTGMTATAVTGNSANVLANLKSDGTVSIAYAAATNVTKGETVLTVTLTKNAENGKATLTLKDCFDQNFDTVSYKIIGENLKLK